MLEYKLISCEFSGPVQRMVGAGPVVVQVSCKFDVNGSYYVVPGLALATSETEEELGQRVSAAILNAENNLKETINRNSKIHEGSRILTELVKKGISGETKELYDEKISNAPALDNEKIKSALLGLPNDKQIKEIQSMYDNLGWGRFVADGWNMVEVQSLIIELKQFLTKFEVK
jgi:hypothetical protein